MSFCSFPPTLFQAIMIAANLPLKLCAPFTALTICTCTGPLVGKAADANRSGEFRQDLHGLDHPPFVQRYQNDLRLSRLQWYPERATPPQSRSVICMRDRSTVLTQNYFPIEMCGIAPKRLYTNSLSNWRDSVGADSPYCRWIKELLD